jgi:LysR family transcriptional regulator, glycine cleavage system transcriptional activator
VAGLDREGSGRQLARARAEEGVGFALARWSLVQRSLEQGRVVLAGDALLPFRFSYYFVCPEPYLVMPKVKRFRDWIFDMAKAFPKPHSLFEKRAVPAKLVPARKVAAEA